MVKLITNHISSANHQKLIHDLLTNAVEVHIAVAFLKSSGLKTIVPYLKKKSTKFRILAGYNFGITDPEALSTLLKHSNKSNNISPYLVKLDNINVFHPKIYLIKDASYCHILIGSANMTKGGFSTNSEASIYHRCKKTDAIWKESLGYFDDCISQTAADPLSERIISIYRNFHKKQKIYNEKVMVNPDVQSNPIYDLDRLKKHYDKLDKKAIMTGFKEKRHHYIEAKGVLNEIIGKTHTPKDFKNLLEDLVGKRGTPGLWYSNGMYRHKSSIFKQQASFKKLIKTIKENLDKSPESIYNKAKEITNEIKGVGPNFIGEIMMTFAPDKLGNINQNPITVLRIEGGADIKGNSSGYNGENYEEYNAILEEIRNKLELKDMLEIDYFFNSIYQKIK